MHCYDWFRRWSLEEFGRDLPPVILPAGMRAPTLSDQVAYMGMYRRIDAPVEGDAVFLSGNGDTFHHIGMVIFPEPGKKMMILHAMQGAGVVASTRQDLKINNMQIIGFWGYEDIAQSTAP